LTPFPNYGILLMMTLQAKALAHPNIAFIKYWGMEDEARWHPASLYLLNKHNNDSRKMK